MNAGKEYPRVELVLKAAGNLGKFGTAAIERIKRFCVRYDSDATPDVLAHALMVEMASDAPGSIVGVGVDLIDGEEVVFSHFVAVAELYYRERPVITISQIEIDKQWRGNRKMVYAKGMDLLHWWGNLIGADKLRIIARTPEVAVVLGRRCGFQETGRTIMSLDVSEVPVGGGS